VLLRASRRLSAALAQLLVVCGLKISFLPQMNTNINAAPVTLAKILPMGRSNGMKALSKFIIG
jgi:hypothetical protein